jgi:hypothetical protein
MTDIFQEPPFLPQFDHLGKEVVICLSGGSHFGEFLPYLLGYRYPFSETHDTYCKHGKYLKYWNYVTDVHDLQFLILVLKRDLPVIHQYGDLHGAVRDPFHDKGQLRVIGTGLFPHHLELC